MLKVTGGVYFLYDGEELVYIGKSGNIFARIGEHIREDVKKFDNWNYKIIEDEYERSEMEGYLIEVFRPKYNQKGECNSIFNKGKKESLKLDMYIAIDAHEKLMNYKYVPLSFLDDIFHIEHIGFDLFHKGIIPEYAVNEEPIYGYTKHCVVDKFWVLENIKYLEENVRRQ